MWALRREYKLQYKSEGEMKQGAEFSEYIRIKTCL